MTVSKAAQQIGCSTAWIRTLIARKILKAKRIPSTWGWARHVGYYWDVSPVSVNDYCKNRAHPGRPKRSRKRRSECH